MILQDDETSKRIYFENWDELHMHISVSDLVLYHGEFNIVADKSTDKIHFEKGGELDKESFRINDLWIEDITPLFVRLMSMDPTKESNSSVPDFDFDKWIEDD